MLHYSDKEGTLVVPPTSVLCPAGYTEWIYNYPDIFQRGLNYVWNGKKHVLKP